jgi:hypothetical protein
MPQLATWLGCCISANARPPRQGAMAAEASDLAKSSAKITKVIGRAYAAQVRPHPQLRMHTTT